MRQWKLIESRHHPDQWYIYARPMWSPFWIFQDVRTGLARAVERMVILRVTPSCPNIERAP